MLICGIDPGITGAVALLRPGVSVSVWDVPVLRTKVGKTYKARADLPALVELLQTVAIFGPDIVAIEQVGGMPGQSAPAAFSFGFTAGAIVMCAAALKMPYRLIPPATWKKALDVRGDKDDARAAAGRLMPFGAHQWARAKDDGRAEAALIAHFAAQQLRS